MLTALVLVCSLALTPDLADCDRETALQVMRAPGGHASPAACLLRGQAYLAGTSLAEGLSANERLKVVCTRRPDGRRTSNVRGLRPRRPDGRRTSNVRGLRPRPQERRS